jgi:hypothetical protein
LSTTIGVAAATLLVMGGILAGPAILDCAKDGSKFGACLRDKIAESGLIAPEGESVEKQILTSEVPSSEPLPEPSVVAETPRPPGWIEANANEYAPKPPALAVLTGTPGKLFARGEAAQAAGTSVEVALAQPLGRLTASGSDAAPQDSALAAIVLHRGDLLATGSVAAESAPPIDVALAAPVGKLDAAGQTGIARDPAIVAIVEHSGDLLARGNAAAESRSPSIEVALAGPVGELTASMALLETTPAPASLTLLPRAGELTVLGTGSTGVTIEANVAPERFSLGTPLATGSIGSAADAPGSVSLEASAASPIEPRMPEPPRRIIEFNPAFPNVLVLPPPNTGEDSSFRMLELN